MRISVYTSGRYPNRILSDMSEIRDMIRKYKYTTELHAHTSPVSKCSHVTAEDVVRTYAQNGCNALTITNHLTPAWLDGNPADRAAEYLADYEKAYDEGKKCGVNVILGMEIRFTENQNDYLVYGIEPDDIEKAIFYLDKGVKEFYRGFKTDKNLILQAHPFRDKMVLAPLDSLDGIEIFNLHPGHNSRVAIAARYARENGLTVSGGTDFHDPGNEALCLMRSSSLPENSYDIAQILKSHDFLFDIAGNIVIPVCL